MLLHVIAAVFFLCCFNSFVICYNLLIAVVIPLQAPRSCGNPAVSALINNSAFVFRRSSRSIRLCAFIFFFENYSPPNGLFQPFSPQRRPLLPRCLIRPLFRSVPPGIANNISRVQQALQPARSPLTDQPLSSQKTSASRCSSTRWSRLFSSSRIPAMGPLFHWPSLKLHC